MDAISPGAPVIPLAPSTGAVAFEALWAEHAPRAMRLAGLLCGRREAAEDLSEADTAAIVGCGVGTVKSSASRGLARLRELMEGNDDV